MSTRSSWLIVTETGGSQGSPSKSPPSRLKKPEGWKTGLPVPEETYPFPSWLFLNVHLHTGRLGWSLRKLAPFARRRSLASPVPEKVPLSVKVTDSRGGRVYVGKSRYSYHLSPPVNMGESHFNTHGQHPVPVMRTQGYNDGGKKQGCLTFFLLCIPGIC